MSARSARLALSAASTVIEGHSIDSLNIANLRRRVNRTLIIQEARDTVLINGQDMAITWEYSGFCKTDRETAIEFSVDSDASIPFDNLDCVAFDLVNDAEMYHDIRPVLIGTEGISKKISVPFLKPLKRNDPFRVILKCSLPGCVKAGFGYYTSTLSFAQDRVPSSAVSLIFVGSVPSWMRVYESTLKRPAELVKTLPSSREEQGRSEYLDVVYDRQGQSARVYVFSRDPA